jgi:hypothetical protein
MHNQKTWEESWDKFNLIVKNHSDKFPLVLGKMQYFKKKLIHEEVKGRFLVAVWVNKKYGEFSSMNYDALMSLFSIVDKNFKEKIEQKIENNLLEIVEIIRRETIKRINVDVFLGFPWLGTPVDQQKFLAKVKGDVDIDNFITTYLNDTSKEYATYVENLEAWKTWWASI